MSKSEISIETACKNALQVSEFKEINTLYLAYSGGLDSSVLVHSFSRLLSSDAERVEVTARSKANSKVSVKGGAKVGVKVSEKEALKLVVLHVNHGLQKEADSWQKHCKQTCESLGLEMLTVKLQLNADEVKQKGVEAAARDARYEWFFKAIENENAALLTAHHQADQAETVLLNLMRGSGVAGLAAIREQTKRGRLMLMRPFLSIPKEAIESYARSHQLEWIEDPTNTSPEILRNRVRHDLIPLMEGLRSGTCNNLARLAKNMRDVDGLLEEIACEDLAEKFDSRPNPLDGSYSLSIDKLVELSESRVVNAIRYWLNSLGLQSPARATLLELARWCRGESSEKLACQLSHAWFYGYRGVLYYVSDDEQDWLETGKWCDPSTPWKMRRGRQLRLRNPAETKFAADSLEVVHLSRQDKCICTDGSSRSLGKLVQDHRMPVWRRSNLWGVKSTSGIVWVAGIKNLLSADDFCVEYLR